IAGSKQMQPYNDDIWIIKTDENGALEWDYTYDSNPQFSFDIAFSIIETQDGNYLALGFAYALPGSCLINLAQDGSLNWIETIRWKEGKDIKQKDNGNFIIAGASASEGNNVVWVSELDSNGKMIWDKNYKGQIANGIDICHDGGYVMVANYYKTPENCDIYVMKLNDTGELLAEGYFGGSDTEWGHSIKEVSPGIYIVGGTTFSYGRGLGDIYLLKVRDKSVVTANGIFNVKDLYQNLKMLGISNDKIIMPKKQQSIHPKIKQLREQSREDKYINLLREGLITKEDFMKLVVTNDQHITGYE
ncbi:MAG: hypothetical protein JSW60_00425, partial [Thermoplasmatales archaeon]